MQLEFDWDPNKAASNRAKHGVSFEDAMTVFLDPMAISRLDEDHGEPEECWVTLGMAATLHLLVVVHTHFEFEDDRISIRIISARSATRRERRQYEEGLEA